MNNLIRLNSFVLSGCVRKFPSSVSSTAVVSSGSGSLILESNKTSLLFNPSFNRFMYTFRLSNKLVRNKRTTRPKKTTNESYPLNYEQAQFAEKIGVTKSWNSWNTCEFWGHFSFSEFIYSDPKLYSKERSLRIYES